VPLLLELRATLDLSQHDDRLLWAAWCLGVFCLMRVGEIVGTRRLRDLTFGERGGRLWLNRSKTDFLGKGVALHFYRNNSEACPWAAANLYVQQSTISLDEELFVTENGKKMTRKWLIAKL
jgi:hypothetical protein